MNHAKSGPFVFAFALLLTIADARGENWPGWRGPTGDGLSTETDVPLSWSPTENIAWKTAIPGRGHSSPVVWSDSVFVTAALAETQERVLYRVDRRTGAVVWKRAVLTAPLERLHRLNSHASSTPATDGRRVFVSFLDQTHMLDRKSTRLNSSHSRASRMPSSA